jgi:hypothetical protein
MKSLKFETDKDVVKNHPTINDVLIYDIETDSLDVDTARAVFIGMYSYKYGKYFLFEESEKAEVQRLLDEHRILVGFNNKEFDNIIMSNTTNEFSMDYKICFDCLAVLYDYKRRRTNREADIRTPQGKQLAACLPDRKLKTVAKILELTESKGEIDYKIFRQETWTDVELKEIYEYLYKDVKVTRELFEYYVEYFEPFREYVNDKNVAKFDYIRSSLGSYAYSAICNLCDMPPLFEDDFFKLQQRPPNSGGFVLDPQVPYAENVVYADFASLYPHIMFMCNMFSPIGVADLKVNKNGDLHLDEEKAWSGGDMFPNLQTSYKSKERGKVEKVVREVFLKRKEYKKNGDSRHYALKVMINTLYGLSGSPIFKQLFNMTTSGDTTYIGRTMINYTRKRFDDEGYKVVYGDTDSVFIELPDGKTVEDYEKLAKIIIDEILKEVPFPEPSFKLDIDCVFEKVWLFKKKNYVGIRTDGSLLIKGLPIKKHNASQLGQKILEELKPIMLLTKNIKFERTYLKNIIDREIEKDISIIGQLYNVKSVDSYKSASSIQCQIATRFGEGTHILIPNKTLGEVGKTKKYCTPEQAKQLSFNDLFLDKVWAELEPFINNTTL